MKTSTLLYPLSFLLLLPFMFGCELGETEEEPLEPIKLDKPQLTVTDISTQSFLLQWDEVENASHYQINTYRVDREGSTQEMDMLAYLDTTQFAYNDFLYCGDSIMTVLHAIGTNEKGDYISAEPDTVSFRMPYCEFKVEVIDDSVSPYCGGAAQYDYFKLQLTNLSYGGTGNEKMGHLKLNFSSNIAAIDPSAATEFVLGFDGVNHFIPTPYLDPALCDQNPDTDIITLHLTITDSIKNEEISGSPINLQFAIK